MFRTCQGKKIENLTDYIKIVQEQRKETIKGLNKDDIV